jgi:hypothetical protein
MSRLEKKGLALAAMLTLCCMLVALAAWSIAYVAPHELLKLFFCIYITASVMSRLYRVAEKYFNSELEKEDENRKK